MADVCIVGVPQNSRMEMHLNKFDSQHSQLTRCSIEGEEEEEEDGKMSNKANDMWMY